MIKCGGAILKKNMETVSEMLQITQNLMKTNYTTAYSEKDQAWTYVKTTLMIWLDLSIVVEKANSMTSSEKISLDTKKNKLI